METTYTTIKSSDSRPLEQIQVNITESVAVTSTQNISGLQDQIRDLNATKAVIDDEIAELQAKIDAMTPVVKVPKAQYLFDKIEELTAEVATLKETLPALEVAEEISANETKTAELEGVLPVLQAEYDELGVVIVKEVEEIEEITK